MFLILIKKAFFVFWDHMGAILIINLGYFVILAYAVFTPSPFHPLHVLSILTYLLKFSLFFIYTGVINRMLKQFSDYSSVSFSDFIPYLKASWKPSLLFSVLVLGIVLLTWSAFINLKVRSDFFFTTWLVMSFWICVFCVLSLPYFFPFETRTNGKFLKSLKKTVLLFFDNTIFSIGLLAGALTISILSIFFIFLLPGIGMLLLWYNVATGLRIAKYDYLEQNPNVNSKDIPWKEVLKEDIERLSNRTLKGLIFPWKE